MMNTPLKILMLTIAVSAICTFTKAQDTVVTQDKGSLTLSKIPGSKPMNVVFILSDDHRYDALGFLKSQSFIRTPNMDRLAKEGAYFPNAFVTTALCSPSRASILTGLYAHKHEVINNTHAVSDRLVFFSQYLQKTGYQTALVGKWHIGQESDAPQRGFDYWVSFMGQGSYLPEKNGLNVNGKKVKQTKYITDELTDYALDFLSKRKKEKPFALYLSHKGVHSEFIPADRHKGMFSEHKFKVPASMDSGANPLQPMWVQNQRNSWHGVDFPYHSNLNIEEYYKAYAETLFGIDENLGRLMDYLEKNGLIKNTLIIYMGDNGFHFGEQGLIDKRTAYEASMRVPMLVYAPGFIQPGTIIKEVVANIDIAPTILEAAGLKAPGYMDGKSIFPLLKGNKIKWRDALLYEYYWERNFPQTPTMHAIRGDRYKYIHYLGIWDTDELYDLKEDPFEMKNLIRSKDHQAIVEAMNKQLFTTLQNTNGMYIRIFTDKGTQQNLRSEKGKKAADFPDHMIKARGL